MYPLKREPPSLLVTPPANLVLINPQRKAEINEENRRLISRVAPVCLAYNLHLWLVDFGIKTNPIEFAKEIAPSTSIGESGENLIQLCELGRVKITNTPLPQNIGKKILCTNLPEDSKLKRINEIVNLSKQKSIALIFGINQKNNKVLKKIKDDAYGHLDITNKKIRLSLDSEIGAVCHSFFITRKV
mgnify:CR=1 FL=1|tara:strand:+ start:2800 stop:3360 length:561 start_codon:yes stop_codon:yes gene_type:complete